MDFAHPTADVIAFSGSLTVVRSGRDQQSSSTSLIRPTPPVSSFYLSEKTQRGRVRRDRLVTRWNQSVDRCTAGTVLLRIPWHQVNARPPADSLNDNSASYHFLRHTLSKEIPGISRRGLESRGAWTKHPRPGEYSLPFLKSIGVPLGHTKLAISVDVGIYSPK
ncbi:hypothetical protein Y032_0762g2136 [Ancylostoma ceylanicum]|uniref:Uncharacterized protein n=1 Tax=Ancylostoma ceylanicum TaxID=53326 RepID=A0A016WDZ4_9BILA|nr:hypothetical protein Y032_0762g2136 [Ancylostoma ceylanicum]